MKREEVKTLAPGLTDEQLDGIMRMNGADIEGLKSASAALQARYEAAAAQLAQANEKLAGYDPDWQSKAAAAEAAARQQVQAAAAGYAAERAAGALQFSSESAKRAFLADLAEKKLPLENDRLLGFDDFVKDYRQRDPGAFLSEGPRPQFAAQTPGTPAALTGKQAANAALRSILGGG